MQKRTAGLMFIAGIAIALLGALMVVIGMNHVFSPHGGAIYYGVAVIVLIPGGILLSVSVWGSLAND